MNNVLIREQNSYFIHLRGVPRNALQILDKITSVVRMGERPQPLWSPIDLIKYYICMVVSSNYTILSGF